MRATSPVFFRANPFARSHASGLTYNRKPPVVSIENATFYKQHPGAEDASKQALFPNLTFSLPSFSEPFQYWSVISPYSTGKTNFLEVLCGQHACFPPTARSYPYLASEDIATKDPHLRVPGRALQYVGFNGKSVAHGGSGTRGAYLSARYESRRESTNFSVLDYLKGKTSLNPSEEEVAKEDGLENQETLHRVTGQLKLEPLLSIPVGNLSNGQKRRARIAKALMGKPEVVLLDEPFMGLDPPTLSSISSLLYRLAEKHSPRVVLALRPQDLLPEWITHTICLDSDTSVAYQGPKDGAPGQFISQRRFTPQKIAYQEPTRYQIIKMRESVAKKRREQPPIFEVTLKRNKPLEGNEALESNEVLKRNEALESNEILEGNGALVEMHGVKVKYGRKKILGAWRQSVEGRLKGGLWWTVRRGERWGIFGSNGSGKTTLLSLICSDHPQTYSLPIKLFGHSRLPTPGQPGISVFDIQSRIGHSSPEVHAFFPRNLTIRQTVENAWADTFRGKAAMSYENDLAVNACLRFFERELNSTTADPLAAEPRWRKGSLKRQLTAYFERDIDWADRNCFGDISISAQRVALFLRAIVKKPDLVILDEAFSGMDAITRDKCMLFLGHGEDYFLDTRHDVPKAEKSILAVKTDDVANQFTISGLEQRQALICISHLQEEVPTLVTDWMCLPEPNERGAVRFGRTKPTKGAKNWWDRVWQNKEGSAPWRPPPPHSCIAHRNTILSEHITSASSQTSSLASLILPKIDHSKPQRLTYTHNQNYIHYIADAPSEYPNGPSAGGLTYLVIASASFGRRIPFTYLAEIKTQFLSRFKPEDTDFSSLPPYGAAAFNSTLKKLMVSFGTNKEDAIKSVQGELADVRGIMTENIERVLERGERIDLLVDKTDRLGVGAHDFRVRSRGLRRRMWWKNVKLMVLLGFVVVFLLYLFVGFGCGLPGKFALEFTLG
ncbi:hypothetical protein MMC30_007839 [Trapelia coarctata]|nr:hypothetical protein [Trapelia coarctata]